MIMCKHIARAAVGLFFAILLLLNILFSILSICATSSLENDQDVDIYHRNRNQYMKISLTFDDGPHPRQTKEILDLLDEYDIKATFFVVGVNAENYPSVLEDVIKRGHEIGNHTYSHPHISCMNAYTLKIELDRCESMIYGLTDYKTKLFRPPEGIVDNDVKSAVRNLDYKVILWDIDTRDWAHTPPETISENVITNVRSGDIILMHDYIGGNSPTLAAMKLFIPQLINLGYKFVVVSELIGL